MTFFPFFSLAFWYFYQICFYSFYRLTMKFFSQTVSGLAKTLAEVLAENLGLKPTYLKESCPPYSSYLRLNRYPPCLYPSKVFGFEQWSLQSIKHRVVGAQVERFSAAHFLCPSNDDTIIESCNQPAVYREFGFSEYKRQVERDVQETGNKIGLERFLP
ncbi:hypothetical protein UlMin_003487 [Ulmus minor]